MMHTNATATRSYRAKAGKTHEGGAAGVISAYPQLLRQVATCLLWEDTFYEKGSTIAAEIAENAGKVTPEQLAAVAVMAREDFKLRHVPLFLVAHLMARETEDPTLKGQTLARVIQRADELSEFCAVYAKVNGKKASELKDCLSAQAKKGLALAFQKFSAYSLAKYNRESEVRLRDVLFLCHAKPKDDEQKAVWEKLVKGTLEAPDTWEVALSAGSDKKATWERLLADGKLGGLALLRNLRNMLGVKVPEDAIREALDNTDFARVLPFRFLAAAKHAPKLEPDLDKAMVRAMAQTDKWAGKTIVVVDISGSMMGALSNKSELTRVEAASALAILLREVCQDVRVYATAGNDGAQTHATSIVPARHGMALAEAIKSKNSTLGGGGVFLKQCMDYVSKQEDGADRVIVITDEQDCDRTSSRSAHNAKKLGANGNYIVNVAAYKPGIDTNTGWFRVNGFSERIVDFLRMEESGAIPQA